MLLYCYEYYHIIVYLCSGLYTLRQTCSIHATQLESARLELLCLTQKPQPLLSTLS